MKKCNDFPPYRLPLCLLSLAFGLVLMLSQPAQAQTDCTRFIRAEPNVELTNQLAANLTQAGITAESVAVSTYGEVCYNEATAQVESFTEISTDFDLTLPVESLTDLAALGNLTAQVLPLITAFPVETTPGPQPGQLFLFYSVGDASNYIQTGISELDTVQGTTGAALMTTLGYRLADGPTLLQVSPVDLRLTSCSDNTQSRLRVSNLVGLRSLEVEIAFDPTVVQVVDADFGTTGVQIEPLADFGFIVINQVDNSTGRINFSAALADISGQADLLEIDWQRQAPGRTELFIQRSTMLDESDQTISHVTQSGIVELSPACNSVSGVVTLQGRTNHRGVIITDAVGQQVSTDISGSFDFFGGASLVASYPNYLTAVTSIEANNESESIQVGRITLLAGDVNGDNEINIFDLSYMANRFNTDDATADLNADGKVDIFDMVLASGNFRQQGPLTEWE